MVAEYWTKLPPKTELEQKIQTLLAETRERIKQRGLLRNNAEEGQNAK